ncbi:M48 family metallopeptidase [Thalassospira sp. HF15]|uniref:M48 family metallopeptidase n=1 Tax=Thalassospira sp. HF15 TaxID=2722755 RepID=UPI0014316B49|nr:M48 family metallopeptidase [Thalassospira sp. HF15]NIY75905.1 M48 family metallopeptidase [Thalassospira sp. HF15]
MHSTSDRFDLSNIAETIPARLFDGKTSVAKDVMVTIGDHDIAVFVNGEQITTLVRDELVLCEKPMRGRPIRLRKLRDDGTRLVFVNTTEIAKSLVGGKSGHNVAEGSRKNITRITAGIATFCVVVALTIWLGVPVLANILTKVYPRGAEIALGESARDQILYVVEHLDDSFARCETSPMAQESVDTILATITKVQPLNYDYEVTFVRSDIPNALALPGGKIIFFSRLLEMMDSPEAFAGVLAHEIAHAEKQHSLRALFSSLATNQLFRIMGGGIPAPAEFAFQQGYTREMESEADAFAIDAMTRANINTKPTAVLFSKLRDETTDGGRDFEIPEILSSHPDIAGRIGQFENTTATGRLPLHSSDWQFLKTVCRN